MYILMHEDNLGGFEEVNSLHTLSRTSDSPTSARCILFWLRGIPIRVVFDCDSTH